MQVRLQVLLCGFIFFWGGGQPSVGREDELCRAWSYGRAPGTSRRGFQCPQRHDQMEAKYCRLAFCCLRGKAHLGWHRCRRALPDQAGITHAQQTPFRPAATSKPLPPSKIAVFSLIALILGIALWVVLCHCRTRYRRRKRTLRLSHVVANLGDLLLPTRSPFRLSFPGTPPPYAQDPPPYSEEDPQGNNPQPLLLPAVHFSGASTENEEDQVTIRPTRVQRNLPGQLSEADWPREASVEQ